jgi:hypothetical protein
MQMDLCYAGKQQYNCYNVGRPWDIRGKRVSAGRCTFASAVEPGHERSSLGTQQQWLLHVGYAEDIAILINGKFLQTVSEVLQRALYTIQQ